MAAVSCRRRTVYGSNMYSYCKNNPVMLMDSDGSFAILAIAGAFFAKKGTEMLVGAVVNVVTIICGEPRSGICGKSYIGYTGRRKPTGKLQRKFRPLPNRVNAL